MKNFFVFLSVSILTLSIPACSGRQKTNDPKHNGTQQTQTPTGKAAQSAQQQLPTERSAGQAAEIRIPQAPKMLGAGQQAAEFYAQHYWDLFNFADTSFVGNEQVVEPVFVQYLQTLGGVPLQEASKSVKAMLKRAETSRPMFGYMFELYEKYLHDPNSPLMNEELYISVLESVLGSEILDKYEKMRPEEQYKMALKNRVGTKAADFTYTLASGRQGTLYGIKAPMTLVFINNPGCPACKEVRENISASRFLIELIANGTIKVLAIYPDEDLTEWRNYAPNMPANWINGYDKALAMRDKELYDLKAIPTVYLLDSDKRVVLKDCMSIPTIEQAAYYLLNQTN